MHRAARLRQEDAELPGGGMRSTAQEKSAPDSASHGTLVRTGLKSLSAEGYRLRVRLPTLLSVGLPNCAQSPSGVPCRSTTGDTDPNSAPARR